MFVTILFSFTIVPIDQSLIEKYGTHEASFYHLLNDKVSDKRQDKTFLVKCKTVNSP